VQLLQMAVFMTETSERDTAQHRQLYPAGAAPDANAPRGILSRLAARPAALALGLALAFVLLHLPGLDRSPVAWIDEVTLNDPARVLAERGVLRSDVFVDVRGHGTAWLWQPPAQQILTAGVYRIFGFGPWQTRLPPLVFSGLSVGLVFLLSLRLFGDRRAAVVAALLFAFDANLIQTARSGRMDGQALFLSFLALWLGTRALDSSEWNGRAIAASGVFVGLAGITHPVCAMWAIALGLVLLVELPAHRLRGGALFATTAAVFPGLWLAFALQTPEVFREQFLHHGQAHVAAGTLLDRLGDELARYVSAYTKQPLLLVAYVVGVVGVLAGRCEHRLRLAILFGVPFLFNALLMLKAGGFHALHALAIAALCSGSWFARLADRVSTIRSARIRWLIASAAVGFAVTVLAGGLLGRYLVLFTQWEARDPAAVEAAIAPFVEPGDAVCGPPQVWYAVISRGGVLHLRHVTEPDPGRHRLLVRMHGEERPVPRGFTRVGELEAPLPAILGRFRLPSASYELDLWRSSSPDDGAHRTPRQ
jgi:4-amino-4-deoxy-L-arabinose transferase-like glycosyltransferase